MNKTACLIAVMLVWAVLRNCQTPAFQIHDHSHENTKHSDCDCPYGCDDCKESSHDDKSDHDGAKKCCSDCNLCRHNDLTQSPVVIDFIMFDVAVTQVNLDITMPGHSIPVDIFHPPCGLPAVL